MASSPPCSLFNTNFDLLREITLCYGRRNGLASDIETNEAFPARETKRADFDKLEGYKPKKPKVDAPKRPGQINAWPNK